MHLDRHRWRQAVRSAGAKLRSVGATIRRKAPEADSQAKSWSESSRKVTADLDLLNHNTGGKLFEKWAVNWPSSWTL